MILTIQQLLNAGSKNLNVSGSLQSPKTFSYSADSSQLVTGFITIFKKEGITGLNKFGTLAALINGVLIQANQSGIVRTIATIKDNSDLCTTFQFNQFGNGSVLSVIGLATAEGFGASNNIFIGFLDCHDYPINLQNGDSVSIAIQDDLSTIDVFQMSCKVSLD